ncbi:TPA: pyridine nucleotide-disulfide oxidoreductase [Yersinia enterocolitica]|nr:pyridine nucleotide-disulfide oxidoreductase [Yersinia enterocolitica]HDL8091473.1 pyridine nucleotide-disulfide oxidoreductase [Yersinia enterocolitica]HDL8567068.1 pyridine nucleotide-disulfide oxidoreductase [Yersinia enterocolitica]HEB0980648.1 pyridine nucleotide-disulfide oxidoreductase [Yersinia enterocolitica]HEB1853144.1 pyridine nucleotide-disulfide oxidoreductase [Yersinia enterocolitica]
MSTPPITAVDAVRNTGLSEWDNGESWLSTDHQTLQVYGRRGLMLLAIPLTCRLAKPVDIAIIKLLILLTILLMNCALGIQLVITMEKYKRWCKWGGMLNNGFNRGLYWATVRGLI